MSTEMRASVLLSLKTEGADKAKAAAKSLDEVGAAARKLDGVKSLEKAAADAGKLGTAGDKAARSLDHVATASRKIEAAKGLDKTAGDAGRLAAAGDKAAAALARLNAAAANVGASVGGAMAAGAARMESAYVSAAGRVRATLAGLGAAAGTAFRHVNRELAPAIFEEQRLRREERRENYRLRPLATAQSEYEAAKAGLLTGAVSAAGIVVLAEQGNKLLKLKQNMAAAGATPHEVREAEKKAWELSFKHRNMSAATNLEIINDARGVFGSQYDATHHVDPFVRAGSFLAAYQDGKHAGGTHELLAELTAAMKSGEIAGKIDPKEMEGHIAQLVAMKVAFGNQVKIGQYLVAQRQAGVALRNADDDFRYGYFPALVQENGPSAGQMAMTAFNKVVAGVGNRGYAVEAMDQIGLIDRSKTGSYKTNKDGQIVGIKDADAIVGSKTAGENFPKWVWETLKPRLAEATKGLEGKDRAIRESQIISKLFPDRNVSKFVTELLQQETKLKKDAELIRKVSKDWEKYSKESYDFQKQALWAQGQNMIQNLGEPLTPIATKGMRALGGVMSRFNEWWESGRDEHGHLGGAQKAVGYGVTGAIAAGGAAATLGLMRAAGRLLGFKMLAALPTLAEGIGMTAGAGAVLARGVARFGLRATGAGALLVTGYDLITHWTEVKARVSGLWDDIKAIYNAKTSQERGAAAAKLGADAKAAAQGAAEATLGKRATDFFFKPWVTQLNPDEFKDAQGVIGGTPEPPEPRGPRERPDFGTPFRFGNLDERFLPDPPSSADKKAEGWFAWARRKMFGGDAPAESGGAASFGMMRGAAAAGAGVLGLMGGGYDPVSGAAVRMQGAQAMAASPLPATAAAEAQPAIMGAATAPITIQALGPQVTFNQAPPQITISVTVNATTNASPDGIGSAVAAHVNSAVRGALHDGGN